MENVSDYWGKKIWQECFCSTEETICNSVKKKEEEEERIIYLTPQTAAFPSNSAFRLRSLDPKTGGHHHSENSHELSDSKSKHISVATRVQAPVFV